MARLHEYQGKAILAANGFKIPRGRAASTADEALSVAKELMDQKGSEVVIKIQAWTTGRAGIGGVAFAKKPDIARGHAARMLEMKVGQFPVEAVLVEEKIAIEREFFLSFAIDDATRAPTIIFAAGGGTGIEERAASTRRIQCDVKHGPDKSAVADATTGCGLSSELEAQLGDSIQKLFGAARKVEARSLEINPLVLTKDGQFVAADCRITIDDYAVARHPELNIEVAREFDHPPTPLERVAYAVEQNDHRGTFYFAQLATAAGKGFQRSGWFSWRRRRRLDDVDGRDRERRLHHCEFHRHERQSLCLQGLSRQSNHPGATGFGRIFRLRFRCCQSGTILVGLRTGEGILGARSKYSCGDSFGRQHRRSRRRYFATHGEAPWRIDRGLSQDGCAGRPSRHVSPNLSPPEKEQNGNRAYRASREFVKDSSVTTIPVKGGRVLIDNSNWPQIRRAIETHSGGLIVDRADAPAASLPNEEFATKDSELLACDVECRLAGVDGFYLELDIPGLDELIGGAR